MNNAQMEIKWKGGFEQFGTENEVTFENMGMDVYGNIHGGGSDDIGTFSITGSWGDKVHFSKAYHGQHTVEYSGVVGEDNRVAGEWQIPGNCNGTFWLKMVCKQWKGWYKQKGTKDPMDLSIDVTPQGVFGIGRDSVGRFIIQGYNDPNQSCVSFVKQYLGAHAVHYNGSMWEEVTNNGSQYVDDSICHRVIKGTWNIPGNCHGHYKLKEFFG